MPAVPLSQVAVQLRPADNVAVAARNLADGIQRRRRLIEPILAGFEVPRLSAEPQGRAIRQPIANHPRRDEPIANRATAGAGRNLDELLRAAEASIERMRALV